ncbi:MAG: GFA family protein [Alcaligenes faecalis]|uniref:GFA family protein n=1 Tax=Alcaligenes sp. TaxID=512 RepID=UPI003D04BAE5|nr:GFA family protein [Alcaligenes faecalis]
MIETYPDACSIYKAACHCGTVRFNVRLCDGLRSARRCNCSYCRMRGAVAVSANLADIQVEQGQDALTLYQFNAGQARHYFCSHCGIYTFHQRRSNPEQYGVNVACIEAMSPFDFKEIPVYDGRTHPKDRADGASVIAGWLRYEVNSEDRKPTPPL